MLTLSRLRLSAALASAPDEAVIFLLVVLNDAACCYNAMVL
jgi:hypothetical protein